MQRSVGGVTELVRLLIYLCDRIVRDIFLGHDSYQASSAPLDPGSEQVAEVALQNQIQWLHVVVQKNPRFVLRGMGNAHDQGTAVGNVCLQLPVLFRVHRVPAEQQQQLELREHLRGSIDGNQFDLSIRRAAVPSSDTFRRLFQRVEPYAREENIEIAQSVFRGRWSPLFTGAAEVAPHQRCQSGKVVGPGQPVVHVAGVPSDEARLLHLELPLARVGLGVAVEAPHDVAPQQSYLVARPVQALVPGMVEVFLVVHLRSTGDEGQVQRQPPHPQVLCARRIHVAAFRLVGSPERLAAGARGPSGVGNQQHVVALVELRQRGFHARRAGLTVHHRRQQHQRSQSGIDLPYRVHHAPKVRHAVFVRRPHGALTFLHAVAVILRLGCVSPQVAVTLRPVIALEEGACLAPDLAGQIERA